MGFMSSKRRLYFIFWMTRLTGYLYKNALRQRSKAGSFWMQLAHNSADIWSSIGSPQRAQNDRDKGKQSRH
ncbi:hypothetical protein [Endozoicomonas sp. Mp262]|uniref:hypothetical protein n=1 Tax=Endozoicomonas sp. Mp262 TaxID=2919499 RepID=UPI0021D7E5ED